MERMTLAILAVIAAASAHADEPYVWIEGENISRSTFNDHSWYRGVHSDMLSGGSWLAHFDAKKGAEAGYRFEAEKGGSYALWVRCNPFRTAMRWKLDDGEWQEIDLSKPRERVMISEKPDLRFIAWIKLGEVSLDKGQHTLSLQIAKGAHNEFHGGIDCIVFAPKGFVPTGARRPGRQARAGPDTWFPVVVGEDEFSDESITDASDLLHRPAGKFGFLGADGADLRFAKSKEKAKFWGCGANCDPSLTEEETARRARYLASHGVNMVRQHSMFSFLGHAKSKGYAERLDRFDRWFAELKKRGIYMTWSVVYPLAIRAEDGYAPELLKELPRGRDGLYRTGGLVNVSPKLQDLQWEYTRGLLEHVNPYTKLAYKDDPALAVVEVQNEDCIFWHAPLNDLANPKGKFPWHAKLLREMFAEWARETYKTDEALQKAWGTDESLADGELGIYGAWQMTAGGPKVGNKVRPELRKRMGDCIRFLTELQRGFYERRQARLRNAGFKGVMVSTAWRAGGPAADPANLYCDAAMDMIDRHNYFGGGKGRHRIVPGKVNNASHLGRPGGGLLSIGMYQVEDKPFAVTEWTSCPPNQWKAEAAPLVAFYGMGLQGWDASYQFLNRSARMGEGWPGLSYYVLDTPHYIGQWPALSRVVLRGDISEAPIAAARRLAKPDLFGGVDPLGQDFTGGGYDAKELKGALETPAEVLAIGKATVSFDGGKSDHADWGRYWDRRKGVIRSMTGELAWDVKNRVVTVSAPRTQAVIGFAGGGKFDLPAAAVKVKTPFVSLIFTSLDDKPLRESAHILITAMARDKQTGAKYSADGTKLLKVGRPPLLMEPVEATIKLKGAAAKTVRAVDFHGIPTDTTLPIDGNTFTIDGRYRTYYYEIRR